MEHRQHPILSPVPGTQRYIDSFHYGPANATHSLYIQSSLHADELPGMLVSWKLKKRLAELEQQKKLNCRVTLVPVANPIGLDQYLMNTPLGRYDLERLGNFNRDYIDLSESIAQEVEPRLGDDADANRTIIRSALIKTLEEQQPRTAVASMKLILQRLASEADYVFDLHCDFNAQEHLYTTPAAWPTFESFARYFGSKASLLAADSGGESFDECHTLIWLRLRELLGERFPIPDGTAAITVELRGQMDVTHELAEHDANAIIHWMTHQGLASGEAPQLPELPYPATSLSAMEFVYAPIGGILVYSAEPGEIVEEGQLIAEIIDPISDQTVDIRAPQAGMLFARTERRMATAGMQIADVAGTKERRSGYLLAQ